MDNRNPGHLTPDQQQKVDAFRKQLREAGYTERLDDASLVRLSFSLSTPSIDRIH
jgi:hypothetical protein